MGNEIGPAGTAEPNEVLTMLLGGDRLGAMCRMMGTRPVDDAFIETAPRFRSFELPPGQGY